MLAIEEAHKSGLLKSKFWMQNLLAGIVVGIVALPLAMAFAIASGAKPEQGLYTAIITAILVAIFGGSRVQIAGPTGAFVVILAEITARYGILGLQIATLFAGIILLMMGLLRFGSVMKYIPESVIVGFTAGIGVIIFVSQWQEFFGLKGLNIGIDDSFYERITILIKNLYHFNLTTSLLGCFSVLLLVFSSKFIKKIPAPLIALLVVTILQYIFKFEQVNTIGTVFGGIPAKLPHFEMLHISLHQAGNLIMPAITIALLGAIESLLSATAADRLAGTKHNSNQELIGQGIANIFAPLFGGFAATGAIARTATNVNNGGNSPIAAIIHSIFLTLVILLLAPFASYIPLCNLSAILFIVSFNIMDIPHFTAILKSGKKEDIIVLLATFIFTIFTNLVIGVAVGCGLSLFLKKIKI